MAAGFCGPWDDSQVLGESLAWRPGPSHYTLGQQFLHIAQAEDFQIRGLLFGDWDYERARFPGHALGVEDLRELLRETRSRTVASDQRSAPQFGLPPGLRKTTVRLMDCREGAVLGRDRACVSRWDSEEMKDKHPGSRASSPAIHSIFFTMLSLTLLTACHGRESSAAPFLIADSAGVAIVESTRPLWEKGEGWTLSPEPEVAIGLVEGDERYLLSQVAGARRLSDGRIAVLDAGSHLLRLYDSTGRHLMDLGGEGDGPSEFRYPQFLGVVSDTLFVYEYAGGDLTWFSPEGALLRTSNPFRRTDGQTPTVVMFGYLEDRFGIGTQSPGVRERALVEGLNRPPVRIWRFDLFDSGADSLFSIPGSEVMISFPGSGVTRHQTYVFGKTTHLAASKDRVYVAPTDAFSIQVFDREGILQRIIRRDETPRRVTRSNVDEWVEQQLEFRDPPPDERAEMRRSAGELSAAETMPAFRWIAVDSEDNLWVEEWEGVGLDQGRFSVFRADGVWLGSLEIPEGLHDVRREFFQPWIEIGSDYLLGVWTDDLGVEQVRLYRIEKG